jgi:Mg2+/Co2+ transporter CorB
LAKASSVSAWVSLNSHGILKPQAEKVARVMVPIINMLALLVYPIGKLMELTSKAMLLMMGVQESDESSVSEEELRMIVMGAKVSGALKSDLQDTLVTDIMRPRVEVVALEASTDISTFVGAVCSTGEMMRNGGLQMGNSRLYSSGTLTFRKCVAMPGSSESF